MSDDNKTPPEKALPPVVAVPEFDRETAHAAITEIADLPREPGDESIAPGHVISARTRSQLALGMPLEAYIVAPDNGHPYVPGALIDFAAHKIFDDMWDTEVLTTEIIYQGQRMVPSSDPRQKSGRKVQIVIASANVRVTLRGENGNRQSHCGVGVSSYQAPYDDPEIERAYHVAIKGAVKDGRRKALELFGPLFNVRGQNADELLESLQQRHAGMAADDGQPPFANGSVEESGQYALAGADGQVAFRFARAEKYIQAWISMLERTTSIEDMEAFIAANAETLKSIDRTGVEKLLDSIPACIDEQYLGLSGKFDRDPEDNPDEDTEVSDGEPKEPQENATKPEDGGNDAEPDGPHHDGEETKPSNAIPFSLNKKTGKVAKPKSYIKAFLKGIDAVKSREELEAFMDANQEGLERLPRSEIKALNDIAMARAAKSSQFPA